MISKNEVRKDIITLYNAIGLALMEGEYSEFINDILEKYRIEIDEDGYDINDEDE